MYSHSLTLVKINSLKRLPLFYNPIITEDGKFRNRSFGIEAIAKLRHVSQSCHFIRIYFVLLLIVYLFMQLLSLCNFCHKKLRFLTGFVDAMLHGKGKLKFLTGY